MDNVFAQRAAEMTHPGTGRIPTQKEIRDAMDVGSGRVPYDVVYGEKPLQGGLELGHVGDIPISATDFMGLGLGSKLALLAKMGAAPVAAALGATAIGSKVNRLAELSNLAKALKGQQDELFPQIQALQKQITDIRMGKARGSFNDLTQLEAELEPLNQQYDALNLVKQDVPQYVAPKTEYELAHEVAQRNAALPVAQGGLGLPPDNTAMDRAKALGYPMDMYGKPHSNMAFTRASTDAPMKKAEVIKAELEQLGIPVRGEQAASGSTYLTFPDNPSIVRPEYGGGQFVHPAQMRFSTHSKRADGIPINEPDSAFISDVFPKNGNTMDEARQSIQDMIARGGIRSRFAAFDPMQRNSANILAGGAAGAVGLGALLPQESQPISIADQYNALIQRAQESTGRK